MTGIANRRGFREFTDAAFQRNAGTKLTVSIIMIDIDYFKQYNDANGHEKGDLALIEVARQIASMVEDADQIAVRWGGEEFVYAAFHKDRESIAAAADALRLKIAGLKIPNRNARTGDYMTISLGTCTGPLRTEKRSSGCSEPRTARSTRQKRTGVTASAPSPMRNTRRKKAPQIHMERRCADLPHVAAI